MPKSKKPQKRRVAPAQIKDEPLRSRTVVPLVMEERDRLNEILADPVFLKAWRNAEAMKPSLWRGHFGVEHGQLAACNRLHELRGWDAFRFALLAQAEEPKAKSSTPQENFPDSGTIDAAFQNPNKK